MKSGITEINKAFVAKNSFKGKIGVFDIENNKFQLFECDENLTKEAKLELIKRLYKPIYIPIIAIVTCFLLTSSKNKINYHSHK